VGGLALNVGPYIVILSGYRVLTERTRSAKIDKLDGVHRDFREMCEG
jgi:hypothetical protein